MRGNIGSTEDSSSMADHNLRDLHEGVHEKVMEMDFTYPRLVQTFNRDFGFKESIWTIQPGDGGNDLEVVPWHKNNAGLDEQLEENG